MDVQVVSSQGQNSGVKTDGAFLPRILLFGFLLVSVMGDSAFPGLQTSVRRGTSLVYSAPRAAALRCCDSRSAGLRSHAGDPCGSSKPRSEGEPALLTLLRELPHQGACETAAPATRVIFLLDMPDKFPFNVRLCVSKFIDNLADVFFQRRCDFLSASRPC